MFADVVLSVPHSIFEGELQKVKDRAAVELDVELSSGDLEEVVERYEEVYASRGLELPYDARKALRAAVAAVFRSWGTPRAKKYRELNRITGLAGTACSIQSMVYGTSAERKTEKRGRKEKERERARRGGFFALSISFLLLYSLTSLSFSLSLPKTKTNTQETLTTAARRASASRAVRPRARRSCLGSFSSTPKVKSLFFF